MQSLQPQYIHVNDIEKCFNIGEFVEELRRAYRHYNDSQVPKRTLILQEKPFSAFLVMPAYSKQNNLFITKVGAVRPNTLHQNSTQSLIVAYSTQTASPPTLLDGNEITRLKCAGVSALVTDICAPKNAKTLAIIGSGSQAKAQLQGIASIRNLSQVRVFSRNYENVNHFIAKNKYLSNTATFLVCNSISQALDGADIVSTTTTSLQPLITLKDLPNKQIHINCMGAHTPNSGELSTQIIEHAEVIVEDLETAISEAGDLHKKAITLADLVAQDNHNINQKLSVFRSTGHALLDLLASLHVLKKLY